MSLEDLQNKLKETIVKSDKEIIKDELSSPADNVEIYNRSYKNALMNSLSEDFPDTLDYLGKEKFDQLIQEFISSAPSRSEDLGELSSKLPEYIQASAAHSQDLKLVELSHIEWLKEKSFRTSYPGRLPEVSVDRPLILSPGAYVYKNKLIFTFDSETQMVEINEIQAQILTALQSPLPIEEIVEMRDDYNTSDLQIWFEFWTSNQIIINFLPVK